MMPLSFTLLMNAYYYYISGDFVTLLLESPLQSFHGAAEFDISIQLNSALEHRVDVLLVLYLFC